MQKIFLITKLRTTNIGNEALSLGIINLFTKFGGKENLSVNGRPMGLDGYYPARLNNITPEKDIDRWASQIIKKIKPHLNQKSFQPNTPKVNLLSPGFKRELKYETIKKQLRPLKRFVNSFFAFKSPYQQRLINLAGADLVVYSGAGEVGDNNVFLRQLVELRVAQLLGIRTAAVNQSIVIKTERFKKLVGHVYGKMDKIVVRGETSKANLEDYGVDGSIISIAPDTALHTPPVQPSTQRKQSTIVGINFTPRIKIDYDGLKKIADFLKANGLTPVFLTNDPNEDSIISNELAKRFNITLGENAQSFSAYSATLRELRFLISTRLHSNILALNVGTPVFPIEGNLFKTTELLRLLEYPVPVTDATKDGWEDEVIKWVGNYLRNPSELEEFVQNKIPNSRNYTELNASWI